MLDKMTFSLLPDYMQKLLTGPLTVSIHLSKITICSNYDLQQGFSNLVLEVHFPAEFSTNLDLVMLKTLISLLRYVCLRLYGSLFPPLNKK